jgi:hypothetical protein
VDADDTANSRLVTAHQFGGRVFLAGPNATDQVSE